MKKDKSILTMAGVEIRPGERKRHVIDIGKLYDFTDMGIPIEIVRGIYPGPKLFISAAIHGDEINGVEIIRRILRKKILHDLRGTLVAVPIVNVFGFNNRSRYLPDRRDLNRSFPGTKNGSLASRIAYIFTNEILSNCTHGIDLHTAAVHRSNLPQIRMSTRNQEASILAKAFDVPLILRSNLRDGSMREMASRFKIPVLVYEGGEALRFNEDMIKIGVNGCLSVMREIGMLPKKNELRPRVQPFFAKASHWVRAPHGGIMKANRKLGDQVERGQVLGVISDPFDRNRIEVKAIDSGMIIGLATLPLVNKGDAIFHIATTSHSRRKYMFSDLDEIGF